MVGGVLGSVCCRLNSDESIQMVTALALQLIQCVVTFPSIDSLPDANARIDSAKVGMIFITVLSLLLG